MRWKRPKQNEERTVVKFAILPIELNRDVRWLEVVKIRQVYCYGSWIDMCFVDNQ